MSESLGTPYDAAVVGSFYALGFGGSITVEFINSIQNVPGADVRVYEVTGGSSYPDEKVNVEASHNGVDWVTIGSNVARDEDLDIGILQCAHYIRVTDVSDANLFEATADGYDLDGVLALHSSQEPCVLEADIEIQKVVDLTEVFPGESVTYTYTVTNPGNFALDTVLVSDDKCAPVTYVSGDTLNDGILALDETWTYTCTMPITENTVNVATVTGQDPFDHEVDDSAEASVAVKDLGCTLTQGYWKNHSAFSKHVDPVWNSQENTPINAVVGWLSILQTSPQGGDAWYTLAHQYIAALLNQQNGAYAPVEVQDALSDASTLLDTYNPGQLVGKTKTLKTQRTEAITLAGILGSYNEGTTGPGHCGD